MAQDLLQKGVEAAKNVDVNQVCCPNTVGLMPLKVVAKQCVVLQESHYRLRALVLFVVEHRTGMSLCVM